MLLLWIIATLFTVWMHEAAGITETIELIEMNLETIKSAENYTTEKNLPAYYKPRLYAGILKEIVDIDAQNKHGRILSDYKIVNAKDNNTYFVCKNEKCFSCLKSLLKKMQVILKDPADKDEINELWNAYKLNRTLLPCFYENMEETRCQTNKQFTKQELSEFVKNITSKRLLTCEEQNRKYNSTLTSRSKRTAKSTEQDRDIECVENKVIHDSSARYGSLCNYCVGVRNFGNQYSPRMMIEKYCKTEGSTFFNGHGRCYTLRTPVHIFRSNQSKIIYEAYENEENSSQIKMKPIRSETAMLKSLKWIFVGGKGGVGKTTLSCSLGIQLAKVRRRVLIVSTDPAHNISDAFSQKFTKTPTQVEGVENLFAMEIDPVVVNNAYSEDAMEDDNVLAQGRSILVDLASSFPGIDEAMSFGEVMKLIQDMNFDVVIFDTAPTGHTLRLLSLPDVVEKGIRTFMRLRRTFNPLARQIGSMFGMPEVDSNISQKIDDIYPSIQQISAQFKDREKTTFVCVCIAEFLSVYETERLIQELCKLQIDTHNVIVNQLLYPDKAEEFKCRMCAARHRIQSKYLAEIEDLYSDFHIIKLPLQEREVRGVEDLSKFSENLLIPKKLELLTPENL
ncbi:ATPase asna1 [Trichinella zimbabwensis]|uniref:ATPase ASNA1 homolog n=1 Tax=Trichinella zimbabwensis TaxID=268475 RepID=A0A0V1HGQ6_9BILA|nr:ATPase asna1 [Trichinella zimbabwensis]